MTYQPATAQAVFPPRARVNFAASYPEGPHKLVHGLGEHPLLELEALAQMAEALPDHSIEYNRGDLPLGVDGKPGATGLTIGKTIRSIETANSWAVLKNIEQVPAYAELLNDLLDEIEVPIRQRRGKMLKRQGFIFVSSANAVTPYHFDPEHNILLQLRGTKEMTVFPPGDALFAPDEVHEAYHTGGPRELRWDDAFHSAGNTFRLAPGEAIFVPVMAPHFVRNLNAVSLSLSITWRSEWSFAESDARAFNKMLRSMGMRPAAPQRWPGQNRAKSLAWRVLRRMPGIS